MLCTPDLSGQSHLVQPIQVDPGGAIFGGLEVQHCCGSIVLQQPSEIGWRQADGSGHQSLVDCVVRNQQGVSVARLVAQDLLPCERCSEP